MMRRAGKAKRRYCIAQLISGRRIKFSSGHLVCQGRVGVPGTVVIGRHTSIDTNGQIDGDGVKYCKNTKDRWERAQQESAHSMDRIGLCIFDLVLGW